jgi:hypothetical protein
VGHGWHDCAPANSVTLTSLSMSIYTIWL